MVDSYLGMVIGYGMRGRLVCAAPWKQPGIHWSTCSDMVHGCSADGGELAGGLKHLKLLVLRVMFGYTYAIHPSVASRDRVKETPLTPLPI